MQPALCVDPPMHNASRVLGEPVRALALRIHLRASELTDYPICLIYTVEVCISRLRQPDAPLSSRDKLVPYETLEPVGAGRMGT